MIAGDTSESNPSNVPNNHDNDSEIITKNPRELFGETIVQKFAEEEITYKEAIEDLLTKEADSAIYAKLGLNYGRAVRFRNEFSKLFPPKSPLATKNTRNKPTMGKLESYTPDIKRHYLQKTAKESCATFSGHLKSLFHTLTGGKQVAKVAINILHSSFLTHAYKQRDCSDAVKDSLAIALRHTRQQAQSTHDRRTMNEKKEAAMSLASKFAEASTQKGNSSLKVGDFVRLVEEHSTEANPKMLIARIHSFLTENQAQLLWYSEAGSRNEYHFRFDSESLRLECPPQGRFIEFGFNIFLHKTTTLHDFIDFQLVTLVTGMFHAGSTNSF